jgi:plastocyanin
MLTMSQNHKSPTRRNLRQLVMMLAFLVQLGVLMPLVFERIAAPGRSIALSGMAESRILPLYFEPNRGQVSQSVRFLAHSGGGTLFFTSDGVTLSLPSTSQKSQGADSGSAASGAASASAVAPSTVINLQFLGAGSAAQITGGSLLPGKVNYFLGSDPSKWHRDLPTYSQISYSALYPGISLLYEGAAGRLKGTYTLAAGADATAIRWRYSGAQSTNVDSQGNLHVGVSGENSALVEQAPVAWQEIAGSHVPVEAHYSVAADGSIGFLVGSYDHSRPLTIDPGFVYSTYLGGEDVDRGHAIAADTAGNAYVTGLTHSLDFPIANAYQPVHGNDDELADSFVTKIGPDGTMVYSTFLGGDGHDIGEGVLVDGSGNVYLSGSTGSSDFPTTAGAYQGTPRGGFDIFITKLNSAGSGLIFSTYLGGSRGDAGAGIAVDSQGNVYVAGTTNSQNYPTLNAVQSQLSAFQDVFVTKMNANGTALVYSTYLGGEEILEEEGLGVAVNSLGEAYVTGFTDATDFPLMNPLKSSLVPGRTDAIVTKFSASGSSLVYSTYLGGDGSNETAHDIAVDADGNAYITGLTYSGNFPVVNAFQPQPGGNGDAFVSKINNAGTAFVYSTYLGGFSIEIAFDIHVDQANNAYVTGYTGSEDFPVLNPFQPQYGGFYDAFVTKFAPSGSALVFSGYLGGSSYEHGRGITSGGGNTYVTGLVSSEDFPIVNAFQNEMGGDGSFDDAFVTKISEQGGATLTPTPTPVCPPSTAQVDITNFAYGPQNLTVSLGATVEWTNHEETIHTTTSDTGVWHSFDMYEGQVFPFTFDTPGTYPYHCIYHPSMTGVITVLNGCVGTPTVLPTFTSTSLPTNTVNPTTMAGPSATVISTQTATGVPATATVPPTPCSLQFTDVPTGHTFYASIRCLACRVIINGYTTDCDTGVPCFKPGNLVTRGQLSKIVANAAGFIEPMGDQQFEDVPVGSTFFEFVWRLADRGIINGYPCGSPGEPCGGSGLPYFRPNANITRGQISKIVSEAAGFEDTPTGQQFEDVAVNSTFYVFIWRLADRQIMSGYQCGGLGEPCGNPALPYYRPGASATRGQASKIVANTFFPGCQTP